MSSVTLGTMMCAEPQQEDSTQEMSEDSQHYHHHYHSSSMAQNELHHVNECQHYQLSGHSHPTYNEAHNHHHHLSSQQQQQQQQQPQQQTHQDQHHHHLHHHHYQSLQASSAIHHTSSIASSSSSSSIGGEVTCCDQSRYFTTCRCSNRLLTTIVITILPIAITLTLITVFMMQKTNLHQYAIYLFVTFCILFVFPFALFFFTVVLNKIYKFYKREIRTTPPNRLHHQMLSANCDLEASHSATGNGYDPSTNTILMIHPSNAQEQLQRQLETSDGNHHNHHQALMNNTFPSANAGHITMATTTTNGQTASLICYDSRAYNQPYYYQTDDGTIVALTPSEVFHEDNPPSYEMALLCPSVTHHQYPVNYPGGMQVILPKEVLDCKEKGDHIRTLNTSNQPNESQLVSQSSSQQSEEGEEENLAEEDEAKLGNEDRQMFSKSSTSLNTLNIDKPCQSVDEEDDKEEDDDEEEEEADNNDDEDDEEDNDEEDDDDDDGKKD